MYRDVDLIKEMPKLKKFALRLAGNASDAEDLVQMTVLRALEKREMFAQDTNIFKWSAKIMFNLFVTEYRKKKRFETQYDPEHYIASLSVDATQERDIDLARMHQAMSRLSPAHREILIMVCIRNLQYQEVSELLQIPVGTVRSRLARARDSLQKLFEPDRAAQARFIPAYIQRDAASPLRAAA
jgi:RNA polymerase sigma-70 factor (ECF subfamily)